MISTKESVASQQLNKMLVKWASSLFWELCTFEHVATLIFKSSSTSKIHFACIKFMHHSVKLHSDRQEVVQWCTVSMKSIEMNTRSSEKS